MSKASEAPPARRLVDIVHRPTVGVLAVVLLTIGLVTAKFAPSTTLNDQLTSACLRIGAVMGVLWLALPDLRAARRAWIFLVVLVAGCVAIIVMPKRVPIAKLLPLLGIAWFVLTLLRGRPGAKRSK